LRMQKALTRECSRSRSSSRPTPAAGWLQSLPRPQTPPLPAVPPAAYGKAGLCLRSVKQSHNHAYNICSFTLMSVRRAVLSVRCDSCAVPLIQHRTFSFAELEVLFPSKMPNTGAAGYLKACRSNFTNAALVKPMEDAVASLAEDGITSSCQIACVCCR